MSAPEAGARHLEIVSVEAEYRLRFIGKIRLLWQRPNRDAVVRRDACPSSHYRLQAFSWRDIVCWRCGICGLIERAGYSIGQLQASQLLRL